MILTQEFPLPPVNRQEVLRYAGIRGDAGEVAVLLEQLLPEAEGLYTGTLCWGEFPLTRQEDMLDLGFARVRSASLDRCLSGCSRIALFAATVGLAPDRLTARYSRISPAKALLLQALGAERIEALCDAFCQELSRDAAAAGFAALPRFSPGYGDLPLSLQKDIFRVLDCPRRIGLTLTNSLLMSPTKSVTAIVGLRPRNPGEG